MAAILNLSVTEVAGSADGAENTSRVKITLSVTTNLGTYNETGDTSGALMLDGVQIADLAGKKVYRNTTSTLYSGEHTVAHSADGTKTVQVKAEFDVNTAVRWISAEKALTLTAIPRVAELSFDRFTLGTAGAITVESAAAGYTHTVSYTFAGQSGEIAEQSSESVLYWTAPLSLAAAMPDAAQGSGTLTVESFYGGVSVGSAQYPFTVHIPADMVPQAVITAVSFHSDTVPEEWNAAVAGHTRLGYTVTASSPWGGQIASCTFSCAGVSAQGLTGETAVLSRSGTFTPRAVVTDSRGRSVTVTGEAVTVYPCSLPVITAPQALRCLADGTLRDEGTCLRITAAVSCAAVNGLNSAQLLLRSRTVGGTWSGETPLSDGEALILPGFAADTTYELQLRAVDELGGEKTVYLTVPTAAVSLHLRPGGSGGAFGKYGEKEDTLQIAWDVEALADAAVSGSLTVGSSLQAAGVSVEGDLTVAGAVRIGGTALGELLYPVGSLYLSVSSADPAALFGGTWQRIEDVFLLAAGSTYAAGETGGEAEHTLTVSEMPSHNHSAWSTNGSSGNYRGVLRSYTSDDGTGAAYKAMNNIRYTGGDAAHNNLPPYLAVYVWQRTA